MQHQQNAILSQLLPYETASRKNGGIQVGLKEYKTLLKACQEAILHMREGELEKFDSLVGENACQIRAVWMALLLSKNPLNLNSLQNQVTRALSTIDKLLMPKAIACLMRSEETLKTIFEKESLDISLTHEELFIIKSYLLAEMKTVVSTGQKMASIHRAEYGDPKKLIRLGDHSTSFARNLLSRTRRMLATASVQFVRMHAHPTASLKRMVSEEFSAEQNTLPCIPMFWAYKTVLQAAQSENIPFILHAKFLSKEGDGLQVIHEECLLFKTTPNGAYEHVLPTSSDLCKPACVVQGIVAENKEGKLLTKAQWLERIKEHGLIDVTLAGAADHRQYPDPSLDASIAALNDSEYEGYKALAKSAGYAAENPTTFFIQHVYAARVGTLFSAPSFKTYFLTWPKWSAASKVRHKSNPAAVRALKELQHLSNAKLALVGA